ncbi:MAG TPA: LPD7 domain-containing protein [Phenylobacterium sp.]|jgi:hypothetical protein
MTDDTPTQNGLSAAVRGRSTDLGDIPDGLSRRYFLDGRGGGGLGFYVDATIAQPAFRDRGDRLTAARNDPHAIRDMTRIAVHRGWDIVLVRGTPEFRREAWLAGRIAGLDVRGYRPSERDVEDLQRRLAARSYRDDRSPDDRAKPGPLRAGPRDRMKVVETVVRARIRDPADQERLIAGARARIARWLERGATFDPAPVAGRATLRRERGRAR